MHVYPLMLYSTFLVSPQRETEVMRVELDPGFIVYTCVRLSVISRVHVSCSYPFQPPR